MKKVCILARVSRSHQNPEHQLNTLRQYCERNSLEVVHEISSTVKGSTSNQKREDIKELLLEAKKKPFEKVIVSELSRLGRKPAEVRKTLDELHGLGISLVFTQLGVESLDADGKPTFISSLIIAIHSELAQHETQQLGERIKSGLQLARKQGKKIGRQKGSTESADDFLQKHRKVVKAIEQGLSLRQIQKLHGTSRTTISKIKQALSHSVAQAA
jgi:DNA invertase Pin-like site-specific DNA recombinase